MPQTTTTDARALIAEGAALKIRRDADDARLKEISAALIASLEPGKHEGGDGTSATIIAPSAKCAPGAEDSEAIREITGDDIFKKLFDRVVTWKPVKAFREVLAAVAPDKRVVNRVLTLAEKPSTPYVKFS